MGLKKKPFKKGDEGGCVAAFDVFFFARLVVFQSVFVFFKRSSGLCKLCWFLFWACAGCRIGREKRLAFLCGEERGPKIPCCLLCFNPTRLHLKAHF